MDREEGMRQLKIAYLSLYQVCLMKQEQVGNGLQCSVMECVCIVASG